MSTDEDRSKREGRRWWLVLSLIAVVIISLLDAYDVLQYHLAGFQGDA
ncbi:MAG: hypothetical protein AB1Z98_08970 [Nannocystaceae bacterium]